MVGVNHVRRFCTPGGGAPSGRGPKLNCITTAELCEEQACVSVCFCYFILRIRWLQTSKTPPGMIAFVLRKKRSTLCEWERKGQSLTTLSANGNLTNLSINMKKWKRAGRLSEWIHYSNYPNSSCTRFHHFPSRRARFLRLRKWETACVWCHRVRKRMPSRSARHTRNCAGQPWWEVSLNFVSWSLSRARSATGSCRDKSFFQCF